MNQTKRHNKAEPSTSYHNLVNRLSIKFTTFAKLLVCIGNLIFFFSAISNLIEKSITANCVGKA